MALTNLFNYVDNQAGAWLLLGFIPFILLYIIKPKPDEKVIPSLMFLVREMHTQKSSSFFQRFLRDMLIFLHIFILLLMSIAAMHPFYNASADVAAEYTVLILDTSASMATKTGVGTRLGRMISEAKDYLDGKISIILVQNSPFVVLQDGEKEDALDIINYIPQTTSLSSIGSSILAADDLLQEKKGRIIVISDFINTDPLEPYIAKESLEAKGNSVEFISLNENANNVGITAMEAIDKETQITLQNYNDKTADIDVVINGKEYSLEIAPNWQEKLIFQHNAGLNNIAIQQDDDFLVDNSIILSVPEKRETRILVITNNPKSYLYPLLQAYAESWNNEASVEKGEPPVMPVVSHDVIVLTEVDTKNLPSSVISKIKEVVNEGATLIVTNQDDIEELEIDELLPVSFTDYSIINRKTDVSMQNILSAVTEGVSITSVDKYMQATAKQGTLTLAATSDNVPIITIGSYGEGAVVYYGIFEANSTFKYDVSYPIFWQQIVDYVIGKDTIETLNYKIGEKVLFDNEIPVITPSGKEDITASVEFNEVGIYQYKNKRVAVNLLNPLESNVDYINEAFESVGTEEKTDTMKVKAPLTKQTIILLITLMFLELLYVKARGDF